MCYERKRQNNMTANHKRALSKLGLEGDSLRGDIFTES